MQNVGAKRMHAISAPISVVNSCAMVSWQRRPAIVVTRHVSSRICRRQSDGASRVEAYISAPN